MTLTDLVVLLFVAGLYLLPTIVAVVRLHHQTLAIFLLNMFLGWSALGWVVALIWSATRVEPRRRFREH